MADTSLELLITRKIPDGTYAVVDALNDLRTVQGGFANADAAEKFIEEFYLARGVLRPREPEAIVNAGTMVDRMRHHYCDPSHGFCSLCQAVVMLAALARRG